MDITGLVVIQDYNAERDEHIIDIRDGVDHTIRQPFSIDIQLDVDYDEIGYGGGLIRTLPTRERRRITIELLHSDGVPPGGWFPVGGETLTLEEAQAIFDRLRSHRAPRGIDFTLIPPPEAVWSAANPSLGRIEPLRVPIPRPVPRPQRRPKLQEKAYLKPEDHVLDEIDQLVNDQVRRGPVDDYTVNRYPQCPHCAHDFHGLDCVHCDCINTDWLDDDKTS